MWATLPYSTNRKALTPRSLILSRCLRKSSEMRRGRRNCVQLSLIVQELATIAQLHCANLGRLDRSLVMFGDNSTDRAFVEPIVLESTPYASGVRVESRFAFPA